jgi:biopolymer transport protein ExbD
VRGDRTVSYQKIIEVMSLARSLGLGVYLVTESEDNGTPGN